MDVVVPVPSIVAPANSASPDTVVYDDVLEVQVRSPQQEVGQVVELAHRVTTEVNSVTIGVLAHRISTCNVLADVGSKKRAIGVFGFAIGPGLIGPVVPVGVNDLDSRDGLTTDELDLTALPDAEGWAN